MSFYIFDFEQGVLMEWDCELREEEEITTDWSEHQVESGANVADYGVNRPDKWSAEGLVTATPLDATTPGKDFQRVIDAKAALVKAQKARQPVTLVTGYFVAYATITSVRSGIGQGDPAQLTIAAQFKEFRTVEPQTVQIPASRLKPKPRPRAAPKKPGGASTGTKPTPKQVRSGLRWAADKARGRR
jgi:hypothetical protein